MIFRSLQQLRELQKNQYLAPSELRVFQDRKLKSMITHAYEHVRYYRTLFQKAGITPRDVTGRDDLTRIPITTRESLQQAGQQELLAQGVDPHSCVVKTTSGSTGKPLEIYASHEEKDFQILVNLRIFLSAGFRLTDKTVYLISPRRFPAKKFWFQSLGLLRREYLSIFDPPEVHAEMLQRIRPDIMYGYASNVTLAAHALHEQGIEHVRPKAVFSSAEMLEPRSRSLIANALHTAVYDILGLVEVGDIAWECPAHEGYHLNSDAVLFEFLDEHDNPVQPGQHGKLVCTSLYSYTMPFIRYRVGDVCIPSEKRCSCGRTLPLIEAVQGRANDFISLPDGKMIAPTVFGITMQGFPEVAQYKVTQEQSGELVMQIVKGMQYAEGMDIHIQHAIEKAVRNKIDVKLEIVQQISREPSGKIRSVVSHLSR